MQPDERGHHAGLPTCQLLFKSLRVSACRRDRPRQRFDLIEGVDGLHELHLTIAVAGGTVKKRRGRGNGARSERDREGRNEELQRRVGHRPPHASCKRRMARVSGVRTQSPSRPCSYSSSRNLVTSSLDGFSSRFGSCVPADGPWRNRNAAMPE